MKPRVSNLARRIDLTSLQLFVAIAGTGSISKAAARESIAVSAASKRLTDVEDTLQTPLFCRHSRGMTLTPAGNVLLHHARSLLRGLDELDSELSEFARGARGHVRVHAALSTITQFLTDDLAMFHREHPKIDVELEEHLSTDVARAVQDGTADVGVCSVVGDLEGVDRLPYRQDRLVLVVPAGHPLASSQRLRFQDSLDYDHVELHSESSISRSMHQAAAALGRRLRTRVRVTSPDVMCHMVRIGHGVGVMPARPVERGPGNVELVAIELSDAWATRELELLVRNLSALPLPARLLVTHLSPRMAAAAVD